MKTSNSSAVQRQQAKYEFVNPHGYLNYELGKAVRRLPPFYTCAFLGGIYLVVTRTIIWAALSKVSVYLSNQGY